MANRKKNASSQSLSVTEEKYRKELHTLSVAIPYADNARETYESGTFTPVIIRQPREYHPSDIFSRLSPVARFLAMRGMVDILKQEHMFALFQEIYWCVYQVRTLATRAETMGIDELQKNVQRSRKLISEIEAAEEELFIANRRLIVSCAKPFFWVGHVWITDFLQEGSKALTNAIRKYDHTRGIPFYPYGQTAIRNRLRNYFRDHVRSGALGLRPSKEMEAIRGVIHEWEKENKEPPGVDVIARLCHLPKEVVSRQLPFAKQWDTIPLPAISLDADITDDAGSLYDFVEDKESCDASEEMQKTEIWQMVDQLPPRDKLILRYRYLEGKTLEETGNELHLTRARIKQIQDEALKKLHRIFTGTGR